MSNLQPNCCLKFDYQKVGQHAGGKWLIQPTPDAARTISCKAWYSPAEYASWVARCDIKGSVSTVLNPIFSKKVQGQKRSGKWGIVEHQIPSIKVLFKTNIKGHKHPSIRLLSKSKTQLVNQRKQKVAFSPGTAHSPEIQSYRTWWGAASPILNDTPVVYIYIYIYIYIYTSYNRTHRRNAYIYIYIYIHTELLDGNQGHQEETHRPTHRFRRLFLDLLSMGWRGCASAMGAIKLPRSCSSPKIMCQSIHII